jgi:Protein of unknown function (DUF3040)
VPLSEHEQRQLEQIEQSLYADHPRLAKVMRAKDPKVHYRRRLIQACAGFIIGIGALVAGVVLKHQWLDLVGFVLMAASSAWAIANYRRMAGLTVDSRSKGRGRGPGPGPKAAKTANNNAGMMDRIEERWRRRQERDR